jgi:hypothetical protein
MSPFPWECGIRVQYHLRTTMKSNRKGLTVLFYIMKGSQHEASVREACCRVIFCSFCSASCFLESDCHFHRDRSYHWLQDRNCWLYGWSSRFHEWGFRLDDHCSWFQKQQFLSAGCWLSATLPATATSSSPASSSPPSSNPKPVSSFCTVLGSF